MNESSNPTHPEVPWEEKAWDHFLIPHDFWTHSHLMVGDPVRLACIRKLEFEFSNLGYAVSLKTAPHAPFSPKLSLVTELREAELSSALDFDHLGIRFSKPAGEHQTLTIKFRPSDDFHFEVRYAHVTRRAPGSSESSPPRNQTVWYYRFISKHPISRSSIPQPVPAPSLSPTSNASSPVSSPLPDKAVDVTEKAGARGQRKGMTRPPDLNEIDAQIEKLNQEKEKAVAAQDYKKGAALRDQANELKMKKENAIREWGERPIEEPHVTVPVRGQGQWAATLLTGLALSGMAAAAWIALH